MALSERRGHLERHRTCCSSRRPPASASASSPAGRCCAARSGAAGEIGHTKTAAADGAAVPLRRHRLRRGGRGRLGAGRRSARERGPRGRTTSATWSGWPSTGDAGGPAPGPGGRPPDRRGAGRRGQPAQPGGGGRRRRPGRRPTTRSWPGCASRSTPSASALATRELLIVPVTHGERSGVVGCAAMAIREVLDSAAVDRALAPLAEAPRRWTRRPETRPGVRPSSSVSRDVSAEVLQPHLAAAATLPSASTVSTSQTCWEPAAVQRGRGRGQRALADRAVEVGVVVDADDLALGRPATSRAPTLASVSITEQCTPPCTMP